MKTLSKKEINLGSKIIAVLGMKKVALALTNFNVETKNIDKQLFLHTNKRMTIYTTGTTFFGKLFSKNEEENPVVEKYVFNTAKHAPLIIGNKDYARCLSLKLDIATIFEENKAVLDIKNAYLSIVNNFESVLAYVIKMGYFNGRFTQPNTQIKYDWVLNPENIVVIDESIPESEVAVTIVEDPEIAITVDNNKNKTKGVVAMINKKDIMALAHKARREMETEDKEYSQYTYIHRMKIALSYIWDMYHAERGTVAKSKSKKKAIKNETKVTTKIVTKETTKIVTPVIAPVITPDAAKEVAPDKIEQKEVAATKTNDNKVIDFNSLKSKDEPVAKFDGKLKRQKGCTYITSTPGFVFIEDYTGNKIKTFDISMQKIGEKNLTELHVRFTEKLFAKSKFYEKNYKALVVVTDKPALYSVHHQPRAFVPTK